jgi:hypothetical protein
MTKKIVINTRFGGFGLSPSAFKRYAQIKQMDLFVYVIGEKRKDGYTLAKDDLKESSLFVHYTTKFHGEKTLTLDNYFSVHDIDRDDPALVQVVEELGDEANGLFAKLKVVEIPDNVLWKISEYNGEERVEEIHNYWG